MKETLKTLGVEFLWVMAGAFPFTQLMGWMDVENAVSTATGYSTFLVMIGFGVVGGCLGKTAHALSYRFAKVGNLC